MTNPPLKSKSPSAPLGRYLQRFTLENVRTFRSPVTLDFCHQDGRIAQWTVILGENGTGKTTLLQYLAGMMPTDKLAHRPPETEHQSLGPMIVGPGWESWHTGNLARSRSSQEIAIKAELDITEATSTLETARMATVRKERIDFSIGFRFDAGDVKMTSLGEWKTKNSEFAQQLHLFGYGASRHVAGPASPYLSSETFFKNGGSEPTSTLFHDDYPLISPEQWLLGLHHTSRSTGSVAKAAKLSYESARRCIINTLPGIVGIDVKQQKAGRGLPAMALVCETSYGEVPFGALSLGYRTMAAWLIDFVKRMHESYPHLDEPDNGPAIVIIDEFDLHMHPKWQREAMNSLSKEFPNTQFIVTAHSPLVVQAAAGQAKIVVLRRQSRGKGGEEVVIDDNPNYAAGWRIDQILESLYGVSSRSPRYEDLMQARVQLRQKSKLAAGEVRELAEIEAELEKLEPPDETNESQQLLVDLKRALEKACKDQK